MYIGLLNGNIGSTLCCNLVGQNAILGTLIDVIFLSELSPAGTPQLTLTLLTLPQGTHSFLFSLFSFRPTTMPVSNTHLQFTVLHTFF